MNAHLGELGLMESGICDVSAGPSSLTGFHRIGILLTDIIGAPLFTTTTKTREKVPLVRCLSNPENKYLFAISSGGVPIGFVDRNVAKVLSPLIDSNLICVEAIINNPEGTVKFGDKIETQIQVYTGFDSFPKTMAVIRSGGLWFQVEYTQSCALSHKCRRYSEAERMSVDEAFKIEVEKTMKKLALVRPWDPMKDIITTELLPHQRNALGWLLSRENPFELPPFWDFHNGGCVHNLMNWEVQHFTPKSLFGGLFADEMGLGKTLCMISLIAYDKILTTCETKTTLVICPPSVLSIWTSEIKEHTRKGSLTVYVYHGERTKDIEVLKKHDIVLTTYATLAYEQRVYGGVPLLRKMVWSRVILDEAHLLKNVDSEQNFALLTLHSHKKWAVTGMPLYSVDIFALVSFLRFFPFNEKSPWMRLIHQPISKGDGRGLSRLMALLTTISLERKKENIPDFPVKAIETRFVELSSEERELYNQVEEQSRDLVEGYVTNKNSFYYSNVLSIIIILRQICTDSTLCRKDWRSLIMSRNIGDVSENPELLEKMMELLQEGSDFGCPVCLNTVVSDGVITSCGHLYCRGCILRHMRLSPNKSPLCPMCRTPLGESSLFENGGGERKARNGVESSKRCLLLNLLTESKEKSIVFSQYGEMLSGVEEQLRAAGLKVLLLDWKMSAKKRDDLIKEFNHCSVPTVLLASLKESALNGVSLTAASTVYLMEPWWDPLAEDQAVGRVHRIGQKQSVKVVRLIAKNTIEEKILELQYKKRHHCNEQFGIKSSKDKREVSVSDVRMLMSL